MDKHNLTAKADVSIAASPERVWRALTEPAAIKTYMFGAHVDTDWHVGSTITWSGEMKGKKYEDKGEILSFEAERELAYSHFSPLSGKPDRPENYHNVTIRLVKEKDGTHVELSQDNNPDEKSKTESAKNWRAMLDGLKQFAEGRKH